MLDEGLRDMETLVARFESDGPDFLDGLPKELLPGLSYLGDFRGRAVYALSSPPRRLLIGSPSGPGFSEFVTSRLQQLGQEPSGPPVLLLTSCGTDEIAGLREFLDATHALVVAPPPGLRALQDALPPGTVPLSSDDLPAKGWLDITPIPLRGRGVGPIAYTIRWADKTVLLSGPIPTLFDHDSQESLAADLSESPDNPIDYLTSIHRLESLDPDLWLPSLPIQGPNANLYDRQWADIIASNYRAGYAHLKRAR
jgi:hypothetical protein